jgi:hypothetical protein
VRKLIPGDWVRLSLRLIGPARVKAMIKNKQRKGYEINWHNDIYIVCPHRDDDQHRENFYRVKPIDSPDSEARLCDRQDLLYIPRTTPVEYPKKEAKKVQMKVKMKGVVLGDPIDYTRPLDQPPSPNRIVTRGSGLPVQTFPTYIKERYGLEFIGDPRERPDDETGVATRSSGRPSLIVPDDVLKQLGLEPYNTDASFSPEDDRYYELVADE